MLLQGGKRGPAISLSRPEASLLLQAIYHQDLKMPPKGKLPKAQIDVLERWVTMGAPWPEAVTLGKRHGPPLVDALARSFWSFRPVVRPRVPSVKDAGWVRTPIDAFIAAKLAEAGLRPSAPAPRSSLLRRVYYDLIGLPPMPEETAAFLADPAPDAYEKVVDRLLASPHYGEKWARHWLDLVRYAETNGYEFDVAKPNAWRYRDYVIRSFNDDKPYDQFIREQLAGDELEPVTADGLVATGYYRLGPWDSGAPDRLQATYDELDDIVATTGQLFLGLTVNCARCHDHKNDPFPQKDYYRLLAFFHNIQPYNPRSSLRPITTAVDQEQQRTQIAEHRRQLAALAQQITAVEDALAMHLEDHERDDFQVPEYRADIVRKHVPRHVSQQTYQQYEALRREHSALQRKRPAALDQALCVTESGRTPRTTYVLLRGNPRSQGDQVEPGFPTVLTTKDPVLAPPGPSATTTGRRRALADWIAHPANPLTARVIMNRLWQHHFGRGIVRSSSDFGYRGTPPTHPELLDWLAAELVDRGWRLKTMHKLIVMSSAYQMGSQANATAEASDPENDWYWRYDMRRLSAEEVRDSILAVCGNLNVGAMAGPSFYPRISAEVLAGQSRPGQGWGESAQEEQNRRSIYAHVKRSLIVPILGVFDAADADASCPVRVTTTQPTQAISMLNSEFLNAQAAVFAVNAQRWAGTDRAAQVRWALQRVTQRDPTRAEVERGVTFIVRLQSRDRLAPAEALRHFCLLSLNLNEFLYLD